MGNRIYEEFHIEVPTQRYVELRKSNSIGYITDEALPERFHGISKHRIQVAEKVKFKIIV